MSYFEGKRILITGGSSGIGEAAARYLCGLGARVFLVARQKEKLEKLVEELGETAFGFAYDLNHLEEIETIFRWCKEDGGKLDGMIHSAGICQMTPVRLNNIAVMQQVMNTNCLSFLELGKYFSSKKYSNDNASAAAVSSIESMLCHKGQSTYAASKSALEAIVKVMARELASRNIRVNAILPAIVDTPMFERSKSEEQYFGDHLKRLQPLGVIEPEQIAYLLEFLLSDRSKYITGACIPVSGAWEAL